VKNLLIFLGILVVVFGAIFLFKPKGGSSADSSSGSSKGWGGKKGIKVRVEPVLARTISETVTASGKLFPETEVTISPEISGEIVQLLIEDGDSVNVGQKLLEIDPEIYKSDVRKMDAALSGAKASHSSAKAGKIRAEQGFKAAELRYNRTKKLFEQGVESQASFETADMNLQSAKADLAISQENVNSAWYTVQSNEQNLRQMQENLSRTSIVAPVSGIISGLKVKQGETVVGTSMMTGTELMKIVDLRGMRVKVDVSETDVLRIAPGDTAYIEVDAYMDRRFLGEVIHVATSASNDQFSGGDQATNFQVEIELSAEDYGALIKENGRSRYPLFPGMSATAEIKTRVIKDAISVPIQAVTTREDSTSTSGKKLKEVVFVVAEDLAREYEVQTGIQDEDYIQIVTGIEEGWDVISGPYKAISRELNDSTKISIEEK
jgi:HlyD family secretion protein